VKVKSYTGKNKYAHGLAIQGTGTSYLSIIIFVSELNIYYMAIKDSNVTIMVKDMEQSISFYQSIGLTLKNKWGNSYAQLNAPGVVIGLHPGNNTNPTGSGSISIGFVTDNLENEKTNLGKLSIKVEERKEEGGQFLHFTDPDGTQLYFIKPRW
jgi:catechol 2,3-dioxygenase-like lactoylglutathione lyase family enzyme